MNDIENFLYLCGLNDNEIQYIIEDIQINDVSDEDIIGSLEEYGKIVKKFVILIYKLSFKPTKYQERFKERKIYSGLTFTDKSNPSKMNKYKLFFKLGMAFTKNTGFGGVYFVTKHYTDFYPILKSLPKRTKDYIDNYIKSNSNYLYNLQNIVIKNNNFKNNEINLLIDSLKNLQQILLGLPFALKYGRFGRNMYESDRVGLLYEDGYFEISEEEYGNEYFLKTLYFANKSKKQDFLNQHNNYIHNKNKVKKKSR